MDERDLHLAIRGGTLKSVVKHGLTYTSIKGGHVGELDLDTGFQSPS